MIPIDWIFDLRLVSSFGPGKRVDEYGNPRSDVFFTFSDDRNVFCIDVVWYRPTGNIVAWKRQWAAGSMIEAYVIVWMGWARWWFLLDAGEWL